MDYEVIGRYGFYGGDELMYSGFNIPELNGDYCSVTWRIKGTLTQKI
jgi:alpha-galactosidase